MEQFFIHALNRSMSGLKMSMPTFIDVLRLFQYGPSDLLEAGFLDEGRRAFHVTSLERFERLVQVRLDLLLVDLLLRPRAADERLARLLLGLLSLPLQHLPLRLLLRSGAAALQQPSEHALDLGLLLGRPGALSLIACCSHCAIGTVPRAGAGAAAF